MALFNSGAVDVKILDKHALAKSEFFNQPDGFPFDGFDLDAVNLPPGEEAAAKRDDVDEAAEQGNATLQDTGFESIVGVS